MCLWILFYNILCVSGRYSETLYKFLRNVYIILINFSKITLDFSRIFLGLCAMISAAILILIEWMVWVKLMRTSPHISTESCQDLYISKVPICVTDRTWNVRGDVSLQVWHIFYGIFERVLFLLKYYWYDKWCKIMLCTRLCPLFSKYCISVLLQ